MIYYHHYFQMASVLAGILFFSSVRKEKMVIFFLLCVTGLAVDLASTYIISVGFSNNYFIINLYPLLAAPLILYGFYRHLHLSRRSALSYRIVSILTYIGFLSDFLILEGTDKLNTYNILFFYFFNILVTCGMLFKMAMHEDYFIFANEPMFWISAGILIFSLGALVVMGMNQFIRINQITIRNKTLYRVIMPVLNVVMYSAFTYTFILCRLKKKPYSPSLS